MTRPRVTLKLATSLDGRIATAAGESKWITGPEARLRVHALRAMNQAVLVGVETAIADDPDLTVRLPDAEGFMAKHAPKRWRVVLDSRQRLPSHLKLVQTAAEAPTLVLTTREPQARLTDAGVTVVKVPEGEDGRVSLSAALQALSLHGVALLMVEGGGQVAASFIEAGLVDAVEWFRAPLVLGDEGRPAVGAFVLKELARAPRFRRTSVREVGPDLWESYEAVR
jgi:diaminohydroxyphosphoribosylaminopyrimidine deaminase / 5-amino-6-(5-phosphoribosylamino)uracil reductase